MCALSVCALSQHIVKGFLLKKKFAIKVVPNLFNFATRRLLYLFKKKCMNLHSLESNATVWKAITIDVLQKVFLFYSYTKKKPRRNAIQISNPIL